MNSQPFSEMFCFVRYFSRYSDYPIEFLIDKWFGCVVVFLLKAKLISCIDIGRNEEDGKRSVIWNEVN